MTIAMVLLLFGGLGMFLYGMKMMSDGFENILGDRMRRTLEMLTTNRLAAVGVGAGFTAIIQSSSAATAMVVGFVNAGLMTLLQATGVILGANIGTTITAQLIAFKLSDIAPVILFVGMVMTVFIKKRTLSKIGIIVLGFGILFVGLTLMSQAMAPLKDSEAFRDFLVNFKSPIIGILAGTLFTAVIQSSSASIGILQALAMLGLVGLDSAVFVILGMNVGACITAILASIGASSNSKRSAGIHLMFNIFGTAVYLILLLLFPSFVAVFKLLSPGNVSRQIANFHTFFNVTTAMVLFPFPKQMIGLITRIIPEKPGADSVEKRLIYLDERIAQTPAIALGQTLKEINRMSSIVYDNIRRSLEAFFEQNEQKSSMVLEVEKTIDYLCHNISDYLIDFQGFNLSKNDLKIMGSLHHVLIDLERIGDHAENIAEFSMTLSERRTKITPEGQAELERMSAKAIETLKVSLDIFESRNPQKWDVVEALEQEVDNMKTTYIDNHIKRLQEKVCDSQAGVVFTNMVAELERVADHAVNIAGSLKVG